MQWQQRERRRRAILKTEALPTSDPSDLESFPHSFLLSCSQGRYGYAMRANKEPG
jgi:hypothetical protein